MHVLAAQRDGRKDIGPQDRQQDVTAVKQVQPGQCHQDEGDRGHPMRETLHAVEPFDGPAACPRIDLDPPTQDEKQGEEADHA